MMRKRSGWKITRQSLQTSEHWAKVELLRNSAMQRIMSGSIRAVGRGAAPVVWMMVVVVVVQPLWGAEAWDSGSVEDIASCRGEDGVSTVADERGLVSLDLVEEK